MTLAPRERQVLEVASGAGKSKGTRWARRGGKFPVLDTKGRTRWARSSNARWVIMLVLIVAF